MSQFYYFYKGFKNKKNLNSYKILGQLGTWGLYFNNLLKVSKKLCFKM